MVRPRETVTSPTSRRFLPALLMVAILSRILLRLQESCAAARVLHMQDLSPSGASIGFVVSTLASLYDRAKSELARAIGVSDTTLWRSLSGDRPFTTEELDAIGALLGGLRASQILAKAEALEAPIKDLFDLAPSVPVGVSSSPAGVGA